MEIVLNKSVDIPSTPKSKANGASQTDPVQRQDASTMPVQPESKLTQTEKAAIGLSSVKQVRISASLVQRVLDELTRCEQEDELFAELDAFHKNQVIQMHELRTVTIGTLEPLPISDIICDTKRTVAVLCGERNHNNTWCRHTGRVLVTDRQRQDWVHLGSCPTVALFADQKQLIVGTASGEIVLVFEGDILWSSTNTHLQTVTVLKWISPKLLLSTALDGRLTVLSLQGNSLKSTQHSNISVSELPRAMKKSNSSSLKVGVVAATSGSANELLVATDTGAIMSVDTKSLGITALGYEVEGIEQFSLCKNKFLSTNANKEAKLLELNGQATEWLGISNVNTIICRKDDLCVLLTDNEVVGIRIDPTRILMREPSSMLAIAFDQSDNVVGVKTEKDGIQLCWFQLSEHS